MTERKSGSSAKGFAFKTHTTKSFRLVNARVDRLIEKVKRLEALVESLEPYKVAQKLARLVAAEKEKS